MDWHYCVVSAQKYLYGFFICAVKKVKVRSQIFKYSFCDTILTSVSIMAPLSKQKRHLKRVAKRLRKSPPSPQRSLPHDAIELPPSPLASLSNPIDDEFEAIDENLDSWVECFDENQIDELCSKFWLLWNEGAGKQFRKAYDGTGRSSMFAKRAEKRRREQLMSQSRNLHSYFSSTSSLQPEDCRPDVLEKDEDENTVSSVNAAIEALQSVVRISSNQRAEKHTPQTKFEFLRHLAVLRFLQKIQENPRSRVNSSKDIAEKIFGGGDSRAKSIRNWSDEYVRSHQMMVLRQGKHQKTESLIDDSDIRFVLLAHLRSVRPETIDGESLTAWISENLHLHPDLTLDSPVKIHPNTALQWLHNLGFRSSEHKKGTYTDGHERPDVVAHRQQ